MIKDALISIKGTQGLGDDTDTIEFMTDGRFGINNGEYFISYDESAMLDTGEEVKTHLYLKPDNSVILQRNGAVKSKILIEEGKRNTCFYATPHGNLTIGVFGDTVKHNLSVFGGEITLKYTLDTDLKLLSENTVNISVREVK